MAKNPAAQASSPSPPRTAVVLIHGIGNQPPMETLRGFVDAAWWRDPKIVASANRQLWVKPSDQKGDYELRRLTASSGPKDHRTDFFEFYWAHMMEGTRFSSVLWWLKRLFVRRLSRVPENAWIPWLAIGIVAVMAALAILFFAAAILQALRVLVHEKNHGLLHALTWLIVVTAAAGGAWYLRTIIFMQFVGDAARYLTPDPENIAARSRIREAGVALLRELQTENRYDRIVLVGHSLGTVVGYDILSILWGEQIKELHKNNSLAKTRISAVEVAADKLWNADAGTHADLLSAFRDSQKSYCDALANANGLAWKITDFITLGSPLTYSSFLLVDDTLAPHQPDIDRTKDSLIQTWLQKALQPRHFNVAQLFAARVAERTLPVSPPLPDHPGSPDICYETNEFGTTQKLPHHAAVFAATRWTNIYAPPRFLLWGDVISGPLSALFGPGVKDVKLIGKMAKAFIAHVLYWEADRFAPEDQQHLTELRNALDL